MNDVKLTEVWTVHAPSFYLMINWAKFIESEVSPESQWETVFALLKAGSRGMLGDDLSIHLKCSENLQGNGSLSTPFSKDLLNFVTREDVPPSEIILSYREERDSQFDSTNRDRGTSRREWCEHFEAVHSCC